MKNKLLIFLAVIAVICGIIFYVYDYTRDDAIKSGEDLYKTIIERGYLIVGVKTDTKPFGFIDGSGINVGFDVDIAHAIAKEIFHDPSKVKFVPVTDEERLYLLNLNKVDMVIATMTITPTRQNFVDFSNAYYITGQTLLVRKGSSVRSMSDLSDKNVGVIFGSTAEQTIKFLLPTAHVMGYKSYEDAYNALKSGHILAITSDDAILRTFALRDGSVQLLPKKYTRDSYGIAFRRGDESNYMIEIVNNIISDLDNQGQFIQLKRKWQLD
ncbi:MAG: transporter substrate-binding domain-containing protein [Candidatus Gastranaerophilales bacterium]|nr:transporter substrate-binding domain-containing protein [Candidatus Gastranaerophilales bacterium]